jgi:hypothetical protein
VKLVFFLIILISCEVTLAADRTQICQYFYKHDIFTGYLHLRVEKNSDNTMSLWMDTPTPYGIRPYTYDVKTLACNPEGSLHIEAQSAATTQQIIFNSKDSNQAGKLEYLNDKNETSAELIMECSPEKIKELCP